MYIIKQTTRESSYWQTTRRQLVFFISQLVRKKLVHGGVSFELVYRELYYREQRFSSHDILNFEENFTLVES